MQPEGSWKKEHQIWYFLTRIRLFLPGGRIQPLWSKMNRSESRSMLREKERLALTFPVCWCTALIGYLSSHLDQHVWASIGCFLLSTDALTKNASRIVYVFVAWLIQLVPVDRLVPITELKLCTAECKVDVLTAAASLHLLNEGKEENVVLSIMDVRRCPDREMTFSLSELSAGILAGGGSGPATVQPICYSNRLNITH